MRNLNLEYFDSITEERKSAILNDVAENYGISLDVAKEQILDEDAENIYEYIKDNKLRESVRVEFLKKSILM